MGINVDINQITQRCYTNDDGAKVYKYVLPLLKKGETVCISFKGVDAVPSSFVNSAFIPLLDSFDFNFIKEKLCFLNTTRQINEIIKSRFAFEVSKRNPKESGLNKL
jgi:hypothetical protein